MKIPSFNIISPKAGMSLVLAAIKKTLKQTPEDFDLIYNAEKNIIDFRIYNYKEKNGEIIPKKVFKYSDGEKLCKIIAGMLKEHLKDGDKIDLAVCNYKKLSCNLYITKADGTKFGKPINF
jgi:hypothetical protein